jgi:hypothetical protein
MDHRLFGGVNLEINFIGLNFSIIILVIYFWGDGRLWRLIPVQKPVRQEDHHPTTKSGSC